MQITKSRRDYYAIDADGRTSAPLSSWRTAKRTGMPVRSVTKVETYTHWPRRQDAIQLRSVTWAEKVNTFFWILGCIGPF